MKSNKEAAPYEALELLHSAAINLENMVKMMPVMARHPLLPLVRMQLHEGIKTLDADFKIEDYIS